MQLADCLNSPLDNLIRYDSLSRGGGGGLYSKLWTMPRQIQHNYRTRENILRCRKRAGFATSSYPTYQQNRFGWEGSYTEPQRLLVCGAGIILQFCKLQHISASLVKLQNIGMVINRGIDLSCGPSVYLSEPPFRHESNIPRKIP